jgi:uncharacterized protein
MEGAVRIGVLADTHDRVPAVAEFLALFAARGVTLVVHAGDYCAPFSLRPFRDAGLPLLGVFGRNDGDRDGLVAAAAALPAGGELYPGPHSVEIDGTSLLVVHDLADAPTRSLDSHTIVVSGATHKPDMTERASSLLVNPGEACGWLTGTPAAAVLDLSARRVEFLTLTDGRWSA